MPYAAENVRPQFPLLQPKFAGQPVWIECHGSRARCSSQSNGSSPARFSRSAVRATGWVPSRMPLNEVGREERQLKRTRHITDTRARALGDGASGHALTGIEIVGHPRARLDQPPHEQRVRLRRRRGRALEHATRSSGPRRCSRSGATTRNGGKSKRAGDDGRRIRRLLFQLLASYPTNPTSRPRAAVRPTSRVPSSAPRRLHRADWRGEQCPSAVIISYSFAPFLWRVPSWAWAAAGTVGRVSGVRRVSGIAADCPRHPSPIAAI